MVSIVEACKQSAASGMEHLLKVLSFVPDDKLDWSPAPTAKSAIQIAAHTAVYAGNFAQMIRDRRLPFGDEIPDFVSRTNAAAEALTGRAEIEGVFRKNTHEVIAALDTMAPEETGIKLDSGLGWSLPMTFLMNLPGMHAYAHAAQLDYLQTCWGDQDVHF